MDGPKTHPYGGRGKGSESLLHSQPAGSFRGNRDSSPSSLLARRGLRLFYATIIEGRGTIGARISRLKL